MMAAIFDLDGTLLDTLADLTASTNAALAGLGFEALGIRHVSLMVGNGIRLLCDRAVGYSFSRLTELERSIRLSESGAGSSLCTFPLPAADDSSSESLVWASCECPIALLDEMYSLFNGHYGENALEQTRRYDGLVPVLAALRQDGHQLAVLTNKDERIARQLIDHFYPDTFEPVYGMREGRAAKPDPSTALRICEEWGVRPAKVCFVGDSQPDMQTAVNAGMVPVGVGWGFRDAVTLRRAGALIIAESPADLLYDLTGRRNDKEWD